MSKRPNPWLTVPAIVLAALAGTTGWIVTDVGCRVDGGLPCPGWSAVTALATGVLVAIGTLVVLALTSRSIAEWREAAERGEDPPGPGCEV